MRSKNFWPSSMKTHQALHLLCLSLPLCCLACAPEIAQEPQALINHATCSSGDGCLATCTPPDLDCHFPDDDDPPGGGGGGTSGHQVRLLTYNIHHAENASGQ